MDKVKFVSNKMKKKLQVATLMKNRRSMSQIPCSVLKMMFYHIIMKVFNFSGCLLKSINSRKIGIVEQRCP